MGSLAKVLRRTLLQLGGLRPPTDRELLDRFVAQQDQAAFEEIVRRHGAMVLRVCQRQLGHAQDAEDAFQATFIVLARKAAVAATRESVGGWLHCVATRTSWHARRARASHSAWERRLDEGILPLAAGRAASAQPTAEDWRTMLDEELSHLPEKYRTPLVLCHLEGKTVDEAARLLGSRSGTIKSQLHRGRQQLQGRLARRGVALTATAWAALQSQRATAALLTEHQVNTAVKASLLATTEPALTAGGVSAQAVFLADATLKGMFWAKAQLCAVVLAGMVLAIASMSFGTRSSTPAASAALRVGTPTANRTITLEGVPWNSANMAKVYKDAVLQVWPAQFTPEIVSGRDDHWTVYGRDAHGRSVAVLVLKAPDQPMSRQVFVFEKDGRIVRSE